MSNKNYRFVFGRKSEHEYEVHLKEQGGEHDFTARLFADTQYDFSWRLDFHPEIAFDLLDLAVAIYTADWHSKRMHDIQADIHISLPVRYPEIWQSNKIQEQLQSLLYWYTEDNWEFSFTKAVHGISLPQSSKLPILGEKEVALWSAGLDSFTGLIRRIESNTADEYLLFGTGSNGLIHARQKRLMKGNDHIKGLRAIFSGRVGYQRLLIQYRWNKNIANNSEFRVRGLAFILLGAVTAYLEGQSSLHIYENGIGAINLPLSDAEVGLDHARSVHPISLARIEKFLNTIFGNFKILNSFWDQTKGQMCAHIVHQRDLQKLAFQTLTCDRLPRIEGRQCGYCTSCLLRRQALLWANVHDETVYGSDQNHFVENWDIDIRAVLDQIHHLRTVIDNSSVFFGEYISLYETAAYLAAHNGISVENAEERLHRLYKQYVSEWEEVEPILRDKLRFNTNR